MRKKKTKNKKELKQLNLLCSTFDKVFTKKQKKTHTQQAKEQMTMFVISFSYHSSMKILFTNINLINSISRF